MKAPEFAPPEFTPPEFTLGVEEEFHVISATSGQVVNDGNRVLDQLPSHDEQFTGELMQSMVETCTPVCHSLDEVQIQLRATRRDMVEAAQAADLRIAAAGTMPLDDIAPRMTRKDRYQRIGELHKKVAFEQRVCGCHVHVGISDRNTAVAIANRVRVWLPTLLAMSANSPFWDGEDTGYASYRTVVWSRWPTATPFPGFRDAADYDAFIEQILATKVAEDKGQLYWDLRLSVANPTLEFRTADVGLTIADTLLHAALCRALARTAWADITSQVPEPTVRPQILQAARWKSARYGLSDELISVDGTASVPARHAVDALLEHVAAALDEDNCRRQVEAAIDVLFTTGTPAQRQRAVYGEAADLGAVVDYLVTQTQADSSL